jgi:putative membrane protein
MAWMLVSWLFLIGLFVTILWLVAVVVSGRPEDAGAAEDILRRRFAAGEINTDEYERRLEELRNTRSVA